MAINPLASANNVNGRIDSLGLDLQSLLKIITTQLTYQDPLKPMDNFEFVSQLAQFTALEQTRQMNEAIGNLLTVQSATQTLGLLGREVDVQTDSGSLSGMVKSVTFNGDQPQLAIESASGQFLTNAVISQIIQVR